jgi:hypothetical protein
MLCPKVDPFFKNSWNKGEAFYLSMETTISESLQSFNLLIMGWTNQNGSMPKKKKKVELARHPPTN